MSEPATEKNPEIDAAIVAALEQGQYGEPAGLRALASLLMHQRGDPSGAGILDELVAEPSPAGQAVTATLLEVMWQRSLGRGGEWAGQIAESPDHATRVRAAAARCALRFGDARAVSRWWTWLEQARAEGDVSTGLRLALAGLEAAGWMEPGQLHALDQAIGATADQKAATAEGDAEVGAEVEVDPILGRMLRTLEALARHGSEPKPSEDLLSATEDLLDTHYAPAWGWAVDYAIRTGSAKLMVMILDRYRADEPRGRSRRLEAVAAAAATLVQRHPSTATRWLPGRFTQDTADAEWRQAVLVGLLRSRHDASRVIGKKLEKIDHRATDDLILALTVHAPSPPDPVAVERMSQVLQDPTRLDDSIRVTLAWSYLKMTGQAEASIAALLADPPAGGTLPQDPSPTPGFPPPGGDD